MHRLASGPLVPFVSGAAAVCAATAFLHETHSNRDRGSFSHKLRDAFPLLARREAHCATGASHPAAVGGDGRDGSDPLSSLPSLSSWSVDKIKKEYGVNTVREVTAGTGGEQTPGPASVLDRLRSVCGLPSTTSGEGGGAGARRRFAFVPSEGHRAFNEEDANRLRTMKGLPVEAKNNPGVRVQPNFVTVEEGALLEEEGREMVRLYGIDHLHSSSSEEAQGQREREENKASSSGEAHADSAFGKRTNMMRVTGRFETAQQRDGGKMAPWGYGESFDEAKLPPTIRKVAERIRTGGDFAVGKLRDVTINFRHSSFFQLDSHVDPLPDGPHVFILGLLSGTVITFSPCQLPEGMCVRTDPARLSRLSWSDLDVDCLFRIRSLVGFTGNARYNWNHGIRAGVEAATEDADGKPGPPLICDWWGTPAQLVPRRPERLSIVFAFADPDPA